MINKASTVLFITFIALPVFFTFCACKNGGSSGNRSKSQSAIKDTSVPITPSKVSYNIYIENSGSMDGYVTTESDFKNSVYGLITDLRAKDIAHKINLNYINDTICPFKPNALSEDIEYFIKRLDPETLKKNGCTRETSYIPDIIRQVITINPEDVNVLISDYIFSTGKGSAASFLIQQKNSVELALADELKKHDFSTIITKLNSEFNGIYYVESKPGVSINLNGKGIRRPYYIIIFGSQEKLTKFLTEINFNNYPGFENSYYLLTPTSQRPTAKIIRTNKIGEFEIEQPATKLIINRASTGGRNTDANQFQFSVATNLEFIRMDDTYLTSPSNYDVSSNYKIVSIARINDETNESLKGYTHIFTINTSDLKQNQDVFIKLKSKLPNWVSESSTIDDSDPFDTIQQRRTFGFKYLIEGITEGYSDQYGGKEQFAINVKVSKTNGNSSNKRSGVSWLVLILVGLLVGIVIWIKNKK